MGSGMRMGVWSFPANRIDDENVAPTLTPYPHQLITHNS